MQTQVRALFGGPGDLCLIRVGKLEYGFRDLCPGLRAHRERLSGGRSLYHGKTGAEQRTGCDFEKLHHRSPL